MDSKKYDLEPGGQEPLRDVNSMARLRIQDEDIEGHHTDRWQQQAMYVVPAGSGKPRRRRHRRTSEPKSASDAFKTPTSPSEHVQQLLQVPEGEEDDRLEAHDIFCEMSELRPVFDGAEYEWREMARWVKFEENVEEGGERWSKPHVASLSLHSLFEVRKSMVSGVIALDMDATNMRDISELLLDQLIALRLLAPEQRVKVFDILLSRHRHQHEKKETRSGLPIIRSLADMGRRSSERRMVDTEGHRVSVVSSPGILLDDMDPADIKFNEHFAKKLAPGSEAANILVGDVEGLSAPIVAFVRLAKAVSLGNMLEVPIPTRFIFILLHPMGTPKRCHDIGRAVGTLMSDEVFHDVAYKAKKRDDLLAGVDEFLEQVTVLPPGEWDPTIRIEPPKSVPSQEGRKVSKAVPLNGALPNGANGAVVKVSPDGDEEEAESHFDPTLERTGRLFGGLIEDVKRKVRWYPSDFKDALHPQIIASAFFMFFASLTPTVMFGALLGSATGQNMAAMECLLSSSVCGVMYHLFSGQPLTIIGPTGPMLVIEGIVFNVCQSFGWPYLTFRLWIGVWMMTALLLIVMFDLSSLVKYITRFTEESFATLIAVIFIYEAFRKLFHINDHYPVDLNPDEPKDYNCTCYPPNFTVSETTADFGGYLTTDSPYSDFTAHFNNATTTAINWASLSAKQCETLGGDAVGTGCDTPVYVPDVFFFSCLLFAGTFILCMALKHFRNTRFFPNFVRVLLSDFAVLIAIMLMVLADFVIGLHTPKLEVPHEIRPTNPMRGGWLINPFAGPWWTIIIAVLPALLATILVFMDQQITAVIVNRKEHKLRKGGGYHLDLLMISIQIGLCSMLGTPWLVASTVPAVNHVRSLTRESESVAPGERPKFLGVREQRVTGTAVFIFVGLSAMMASVLEFIPMPVLYGVSLFMGVASLAGLQLVQRLLITLMPVKYQPDYAFLRHVPLKRVNLFTAIQFIFLVIMGVIEMIEITSIIFPLMVLALCFVRKALDWVFTQQELRWLDDIIPDASKREKEDKKKKKKKSIVDTDFDEPSDEPKVFDMGEAGTVTIPIRGGQPLTLPANQVTYDSKTHKLNISEEMSKTAIWRLMVSDSQNNLNAAVPQEKRSSNTNTSSGKPSRSSDDDSAYPGKGKKEPVTFRIEEDEAEALVTGVNNNKKNTNGHHMA